MLNHITRILQSLRTFCIIGRPREMFPDSSVDRGLQAAHSIVQPTPEAAQTFPLVTLTASCPAGWQTTAPHLIFARPSATIHPPTASLPISRRRVRLIVCHVYRENHINDTPLIRWHVSNKRNENDDYLWNSLPWRQIMPLKAYASLTKDVHTKFQQVKSAWGWA